MPFNTSRIASQLRDFINTNHICTGELDEEAIQCIREATEKDPEELTPRGVTKRKGKARRSVAPRFPPEWATSMVEFRKAVYMFLDGSKTKQTETYPEPKLSDNYLPSPSSALLKSQTSRQHDGLDQLFRNTRAVPERCNFVAPAVPWDVMALFSGLEKLGDTNWTSWKGNMKDYLEMCDLWEIVSGHEKMPTECDVRGAESWLYREKVARILIKNSLRSRNYNQIQ